jgi:hypothetical protein
LLRIFSFRSFAMHVDIENKKFFDFILNYNEHCFEEASKQNKTDTLRQEIQNTHVLQFKPNKDSEWKLYKIKAQINKTPSHLNIYLLSYIVLFPCRLSKYWILHLLLVIRHLIFRTLRIILIYNIRGGEKFLKNQFGNRCREFKFLYFIWNNIQIVSREKNFPHKFMKQEKNYLSHHHSRLILP